MNFHGVYSFILVFMFDNITVFCEHVLNVKNIFEVDSKNNIFQISPTLKTYFIKCNFIKDEYLTINYNKLKADISGFFYDVYDFGFI